MPVTLHDMDNTPLEADFLGFSGGERHVQLGKMHGGDRIIRADLRGSDDVFNLLLLANAVVEADRNARLHIEIPYLPYARQDRVCAPGQAFSMKVLARLLGTMENVARLIVWDCHSPVGLELTGAVNIPAQDIIHSSDALTRMIVSLDSVLICPDKGAVARTEAVARAFQKDLQPEPIVFCEKVRDPATGQITHTEVKTDSLVGRTAIITDDICDGGYTFIKVAEQIRAKGAERVVLYVTHGIFSKGLGVFDSLIDAVFTTDSFVHDPHPLLSVIPFEYDFTA